MAELMRQSFNGNVKSFQSPDFSAIRCGPCVLAFLNFRTRSDKKGRLSPSSSISGPALSPIVRRRYGVSNFNGLPILGMIRILCLPT
jgi:hypothetical protein